MIKSKRVFRGGRDSDNSNLRAVDGDAEDSGSQIMKPSPVV